MENTCYPSSPVICNGLGNAAPVLSDNPICPANFLTAPAAHTQLVPTSLAHTLHSPAQLHPQALLHPRVLTRASKPGFQAACTSQGHKRNRSAAAEPPAWVLAGYGCFLQQHSLEFPCEYSNQLPLPFQMLQNNGVKFYMETELCELKGKDGKVSHAIVINQLLILGEKNQTEA